MKKSVDLNRHVYIIGSGAVGRALAVLAKCAGREVTLIRGSVNDGSSKMEMQGVELADGTVQQSALRVSTLKSFLRIDGIVVIASKAYGNSQLAASLRGKTGESPIVILQNGLGVEKAFVDSGFPAVYRCVLFVTSQVISESHVRFKPVTTCPIGVAYGNPELLNEVVSYLSTPEFCFSAEPDIQSLIWKKAIVNCVFNSLCPLLEVDNGLFQRNVKSLDIARRIISECQTVALAKGVKLEPEDIEERLLRISRLSDGQEISTLQDIRHGRKTEMDSLNMEVVRIAESLGLTEAVKETRLLGELIQLRSELTMIPYENITQVNNENNINQINLRT